MWVGLTWSGSMEGLREGWEAMRGLTGGWRGGFMRGRREGRMAENWALGPRNNTAAEASARAGRWLGVEGMSCRSSAHPSTELQGVPQTHERSTSVVPACLGRRGFP